MQLNLIGVNHQTAPLTIREKLAISGEKLSDSLSLLRSYLRYGIILSTCNRTEIYTTGDKENGEAEKVSLDFIKSRLNISDNDLLQYVYVAKDKAAVKHLFRVASGLESMIVGEFEVLGQVGNALDAAEKARMVNLPLRRLFQSAIRTGRRVRNQTGISKSALSVSSVAVDLAVNIFGDLKGCKMLVIGTGEAGRLVAKAAKERGVPQIVIASRTKERAQALASTLHGIPIDWSSLMEHLSIANIVVTCAGAPRYILEAKDIEASMANRPHLPMIIIDIAVPRNVSPEVGQVMNVSLYNIDDLTGIANRNRQQREKEIHWANEIVTAEVDKFFSWWRDFEVRPIISALMNKAEEIRTRQLNLTLRKLPPLPEEQRKILEALTKSIVTKLFNDPIQYLKTKANSSHGERLKELFRLNTEERS